MEVASPVKADGVGVLDEVLYDVLDALLAKPPRGEQSAFARSEVTTPVRGVSNLKIDIYIYLVQKNWIEEQEGKEGSIVL